MAQLINIGTNMITINMIDVGILDEQGCLSNDYIRTRDFKTIMFPGDVDLIYVELFCQAQRKLSNKNLNTYIYHDLRSAESGDASPQRDVLAPTLSESIGSLFEDQNRKGVFFKGFLENYYIVAGSPDFMAAFYPVSHTVADELFVHWMNHPFHKLEARQRLEALRARYDQFKYTNSL